MLKDMKKTVKSIAIDDAGFYNEIDRLEETIAERDGQIAWASREITTAQTELRAARRVISNLQRECERLRETISQQRIALEKSRK